jgi:tetratricopeptide (TPR) repeat protein
VLETLVNTAAKLRRKDDTAAALTMLVQRWPEQIAELDEHFTLQFLAESRQLAGEKRLPLLQALYDAHWKLKWEVEPSTAWRDLAVLLLEKGRLSEAVEVVGHVTDTYVLIAMRADRRFDPVADAAPAQFDIAAAALRELRGLQAKADATPNSLELQSHTIEALGNQLHYGAMLAATDAVVSEVTATNYPDKLYPDYDDQYQWILSDRAAALERFAEWDEAVSVLTNSSQLIGADAGQPLDLAALYCDLGRPKEALSALEQIAADPNAFGEMQVELVKLDAASQLGDTKQVTRSLRYLSDHRSDSPSTYQAALVLVNQIDKAAELLVTRLRDPSNRLDALETIQTYVEPPATARRMELDARWQAVIARPEVRSTIDKVGRVDSYHLEPPDIFD